MTIDISIGKLKRLTFEEVFENKREDCTFSFKNTISMIDFIEIEQCPDDIDGCTKEDTIHPNEAYRSGSCSSMSNFFQEVLPELIYYLSPNDSNDKQITLLKPFIKDINALIYNGNDEQHKIRLLWLKFWCNRAVNLYGDDAVIQFT